jgi:hypothetical protein
LEILRPPQPIALFRMRGFAIAWPGSGCSTLLALALNEQRVFGIFMCMHYSKLYNPIIFVGIGVLLSGVCAFVPSKHYVMFTFANSRLGIPVNVVLSYLSLAVFSAIAVRSAVHVVRSLMEELSRR